MSNIATTIEQSKHLLEFGLDIKSADMCLCKSAQDTWFLCAYTPGEYDSHTVPAWSLSALLEVIPSNIGDYDLYITKHKYVDGGHGYNVEYNRGFTISVLHKETSRDLVAAAYEMVCWLLEQKILTFNNNEKD